MNLTCQSHSLIAWDIENVKTNKYTSCMFSLCEKIRKIEFLKGCTGNKIYISCNVKKFGNEMIKTLKQAENVKISHVESGKNAADEDLKEYIEEFIELHKHKFIKLVLITGDSDFMEFCSHIRKEYFHVEILLIYPSKICSSGLKQAVHKLLSFDKLISDDVVVSDIEEQEEPPAWEINNKSSMQVLTYEDVSVGRISVHEESVSSRSNTQLRYSLVRKFNINFSLFGNEKKDFLVNNHLSDVLSFVNFNPLKSLSRNGNEFNHHIDKVEYSIRFSYIIFDENGILSHIFLAIGKFYFKRLSNDDNVIFVVYLDTIYQASMLEQYLKEMYGNNGIMRYMNFGPIRESHQIILKVLYLSKSLDTFDSGKISDKYLKIFNEKFENAFISNILKKYAIKPITIRTKINESQMVVRHKNNIANYASKYLLNSTTAPIRLKDFYLKFLNEYKELSLKRKFCAYFDDIIICKAENVLILQDTLENKHIVHANSRKYHQIVFECIHICFSFLEKDLDGLLIDQSKFLKRYSEMFPESTPFINNLNKDAYFPIAIFGNSVEIQIHVVWVYSYILSKIKTSNNPFIYTKQIKLSENDEKNLKAFISNYACYFLFEYVNIDETDQKTYGAFKIRNNNLMVFNVMFDSFGSSPNDGNSYCKKCEFYNDPSMIFNEIKDFLINDEKTLWQI